MEQRDESEADRSTDMRETTSVMDSGYVGISLTGITREKKIVQAAQRRINGLTIKSFSQRRPLLL